MNNKVWLISMFFSIFFWNCNTNDKDLDLSKEQIQFTFKRFEKSLFKLKGKEITKDEAQQLEEEYGKFYALFVQRIIHVGTVDSTSTRYYLGQFVNDDDIQKVYQQTMDQYSDVSEIKESLKKSFKYYHHYFPQDSIPKIYTYVSGFNYATVTDTNILGIGLDMYLGKDYAVYSMLNIPQYQLRTMEKEYIPVSTMKGWLLTEFPKPDTLKDILGNMIYYGKIFYTLSHLMPDTPDTLKIGYTKKELKWCRDNEKKIWRHFINKKLLYNTEAPEIKKVIGEGPFTPGFPEGSPGKVGRWLGWQIVKKYMKENPKTKLNELFTIPPDQSFLIASHYKPR